VNKDEYIKIVQTEALQRSGLPRNFFFYKFMCKMV